MRSENVVVLFSVGRWLFIQKSCRGQNISEWSSQK